MLGGKGTDYSLRRLRDKSQMTRENRGKMWGLMACLRAYFRKRGFICFLRFFNWVTFAFLCVTASSHLRICSSLLLKSSGRERCGPRGTLLPVTHLWLTWHHLILIERYNICLRSTREKKTNGKGIKRRIGMCFISFRNCELQMSFRFSVLSCLVFLSLFLFFLF